jgi:hypothetical protein
MVCKIRKAVNNKDQPLFQSQPFNKNKKDESCKPAHLPALPLRDGLKNTLF